MGEAYKIFTIASGHVDEGAKIEKLLLKGAGIEIPALIIGEAGRGRSRGVLPVHLPNELYREWQKKGSVTIQAAEIGRTKAGKPKLFVQEETTTTEKIIGVFRTQIGFRGGNSHTGDRTGEMKKDIWGRKQPIFHPFPGEILVRGVIAQGAAGRMGSGSQLVAVMPRGVVFRTGYSGRLYGAPAAHYYLWNGEKLLSVTWDERLISDIF